MKKGAYEVEYYETKSVLAMQADRQEEKHRRKQKNLAYDIYFTSMSTISGFLAGTLGSGTTDCRRHEIRCMDECIVKIVFCCAG